MRIGTALNALIILLVPASGVIAQEDEWYWDEDSQMYYAADEYGIIYL